MAKRKASGTHYVTVHEAKTHLSRLIEEVLEGKNIVVTRRHVPLIRLTVVETAKPARQLGAAKGDVKMSRDFDRPIDDLKDYM